jgi:hypothetical protein
MLSQQRNAFQQNNDVFEAVVVTKAFVFLLRWVLAGLGGLVRVELRERGARGSET